MPAGKKNSRKEAVVTTVRKICRKVTLLPAGGKIFMYKILCYNRNMKKILFLVLLAIAGLVFCTVPAGAMTAQDLTITVLENGDANIRFTYDLNWLEQVAVYTKIADPGKELKTAIENNFKATVDVIDTDNSHATILVHSFAAVKQTPDGTTYTTPELSFANAERVLKQYWFAPLITVDLSPAQTRVIFPDGYVQSYANQIGIPKISHTVPG